MLDSFEGFFLLAAWCTRDGFSSSSSSSSSSSRSRSSNSCSISSRIRTSNIQLIRRILFVSWNWISSDTRQRYLQIFWCCCIIIANAGVVVVVAAVIIFVVAATNSDDVVVVVVAAGVVNVVTNSDDGVVAVTSNNASDDGTRLVRFHSLLLLGRSATVAAIEFGVSGSETASMFLRRFWCCCCCCRWRFVFLPQYLLLFDKNIDILDLTNTW